MPSETVTIEVRGLARVYARWCEKVARLDVCGLALQEIENRIRSGLLRGVQVDDILDQMLTEVRDGDSGQ